MKDIIYILNNLKIPYCYYLKEDNLAFLKNKYEVYNTYFSFYLYHGNGIKTLLDEMLRMFNSELARKNLIHNEGIYGWTFVTHE